MSKIILECKNINKKYKKKDHYHSAARDISFQLRQEPEELVLIQ